MDDTRILNSIRVLFEDRPFICQYDGCFYAAKRRDHLNNHIRLHNNEKPFKCDICDECFTQKSLLNAHKAKHDEKKWVCAICDAKFYEKNKLIIHGRIHDKTTYYKCDYPECDAEFSQESNLITHKMRHRGDKPYTCTFEDCDAAFVDSSKLKIHMRGHTGENPYICEYPGCDMKFKQAGHLQVHMRIHTDEKPYKCSYEDCDSAFTTSSNLKIHERFHSGEKPYTCVTCDKSFATSSGLLTHIRVHTNERPYQCDKCEAKFKTQSYLIVHKRLHTDIRPYKCEFSLCEAQFNQLNHLKSHYEFNHTDQAHLRKKIKEERVAKALDQANIKYKREHYVDLSCFGGSYAREDFILDYCPGGIVVIEVDENQHDENKTNYTVGCEMRRMLDIQNALIINEFNLPKLIIRFNPDIFVVNGVKCNISIDEKLNTLIEYIKNITFVKDSSRLQLQYMFYDVSHIEDKITLDIFDHPDFYQDFKSCSLPPIISRDTL